MQRDIFYHTVLKSKRPDPFFISIPSLVQNMHQTTFSVTLHLIVFILDIVIPFNFNNFTTNNFFQKLPLVTNILL